MGKREFTMASEGLGKEGNVGGDIDEYVDPRARR